MHMQNVPFGYKLENGKLVPDPIETKIVNRLYRFISLLDKYNIPFNREAELRFEMYFERLADKYGVKHKIMLPVYFSDNTLKGSLKIKFADELKVVQDENIISEEVFNKAKEKLIRKKPL